MSQHRLTFRSADHTSATTSRAPCRSAPTPPTSFCCRWRRPAD